MGHTFFRFRRGAIREETDTALCRKGELVSKTFNCKDVGMNCDWKAKAETEEELMRKITQHAKSAHQMNELSKQLSQKVHAAIHEERKA